ncbi:MAG TPA: RNA polymerase sigma factor SigZ [Bacteroidetes bacterium]|nr:RNA polymerase sigma factor SigZ [Bacteroidota bacterium]
MPVVDEVPSSLIILLSSYRGCIVNKIIQMDEPQQILDVLYRSFSDRLQRFIRTRVSDSAAADDLLHDIFLKIHHRIDTLQDETKLESWIFQIARNAIIDYHRRKNIPAQLDAAADVRDDAPGEDASKRIEPSVRAFIDQLPGEYREALLLVEYEGISQKDLARRLGISVSGAKSRVQRARRMLKDQLMQCCHFEFDRYGKIIDYHPISCCCCSPRR